MFFNLSEQHSIAHEYLRELRDVEVQTDRMRFRRNMERLGEILAYEISKTLFYRDASVKTPLDQCAVKILDAQPLLITVLRAGVPFLNGFVNVFDKGDVGFVGAFREEGGKDIKIRLDYVATPSLQGRTVILVDPMLATGRSVVHSLEVLFEKGMPDRLHIASLIASPEGIELVTQFLTKASVNFKIWTCTLDEKLNAQFYIVPGLGDAGDLSFGRK